MGMKENNGIEVSVEKVGGARDVVLLRCVGYIDTYNSSDFSRVVNSVITGGAKNLVFDLSKVPYASSTGIGTLPAFLKQVKPKGGDVVLVSPTANVLEVLRLLGFASFFNVEHSLEEALEHFPQTGWVPNVPFEKMRGITDSCGRLEKFVQRDRQADFYADLLAVLRQIQDLRATEAVRA
jgi:anti-anti-sigma factor